MDTAPPSVADFDTLGVVACAGEFPRLVIEGARRAGKRIVCVGCRGAVNRAEIQPLCDVYTEARVGAIEGPRRFLAEHGAHHVILAGQIKPACIYTLWPDADARRLLRTLPRRNAHTIFSTVCDYLAAGGVEVLPSTMFMESCMPAAGHLAGPAPTAEQTEAARFGMCMAQQIARLDIGQSVVVQGQRVVCAEAYKGTNECIDAAGHRPGLTLCKVTKPGHDMRFDVPCMGLATLRHCLRGGIRHVVFEAGKTILFQKEQMFALCEREGITLQALEAPHQEDRLTAELGRPAGDAAHAARLARALEALGIGHAAIVCDGVVLAVEDADGAEKCIRRAAAYMHRLRLARLISWVRNRLKGRASEPPKPMVMVSTPSHPLSESARRMAKRCGIICG